MKIREEGVKSGVIYQFEDSFEGHNGTVIVDISYSSNEDEDGNDILEFEWASIIDEVNPKLTEIQISDFNKELENGREEQYVKFLVCFYEGSDVNFNPNHYKI